MTIAMVQERFEEYACESKQDAENALKEIAQNIVLLALFRSEFFKVSAFHGGTCLRILHGMQRFSEDLDFCLQAPNPDFSWDVYVRGLRDEFSAFGFDLEILDRSLANKPVKAIFLKDDSIGKLLNLQSLSPDGRLKKIRVKLEIDTNPPSGARTETRYTDFPLPHPVTTHDLPTCFAGKMHALLCREYTKGRDWYDFVWYTSRRTPINREFLKSALEQQGPWKNQSLNFGIEWIQENLQQRIAETKWKQVTEELTRFVRPKDRQVVSTWTTDFVNSRIERIEFLE